MWETIWQWAKSNTSIVSVGSFFLWGLLIALGAPLMVTWLVWPILLLAHLISAMGIYFGYILNPEGKRSVLGMVLGIVTMLYNLSLDFLYLFI